MEFISHFGSVSGSTSLIDGTLLNNLEKIFRQFRALGLRHLVVVDSEMKPTGIITRKDIARFRKHRDHTNRLPINQFQSSTVIYD